MRHLLGSLALASLAGCATMQPHDFSAVAGRKAAAVVQVSALGAFGPEGQSGFLVSEDGHIITNSYLLEVSTPEEVTVRLADRRTFRATVVGADPLSDIALLKIEARGLPTVRLGNAGDLQPGASVATIGSPLRPAPGVNAGIVRAVDATLPGESHVPFIETDAAGHPGNSGGPLVNTRGEVVGVSSSIYGRSGGFSGASFAVPIGVAMEVVAELLRYGKVTRGRIGVRVQSLSHELARALRVPDGTGALLIDVLHDSPAAHAGLRSADVVLAFGSAEVGSHVGLMRMIADARPGETVPVRYVREGRLAGAHLTVASARDTTDMMPEQARVPGDLATLIRARLQAAARSRASVEPGLLVRHIAGLMPPARLQPGDVIVLVNGRPPASVRDFQEQLAGATDAGLVLLVQRDSERRFVVLKPAE